ncbi:MAG TPA: FAD:protein FMN transferase [Fimbriiglobus sp.]|jgi:thiamine biosynthesis lipoprotein
MAGLWIILLAVSVSPFTPAGAADEPNRHEFESVHMGTKFRIVVYADKATAGKAAKAAFARVAALENVMSDYKRDSELMKLCTQNDRQPGRPIKVSEDLFRVLSRAEKISTLSDGAFDVTVGPLSALWRITRRTQELPDAKELAEARELVGYRKVVLDPKAKSVAVKRKGMRLDLGGIAKGDAADQALIVLKSFGVDRALVAASGDIAVSDPPPGKGGWTVEIAPLGKEKPKYVLLANAAVSTSGDLFQYVEIKGVRYSHVLDPKTGLGQTGWRSATVIAKRGIEADSLTKAALLLPPDRAVKLIDAIYGAATFVAVKETEESKVTTFASKRFHAYLTDPPK